jgi:hypothetical protein
VKHLQLAAWAQEEHLQLAAWAQEGHEHPLECEIWMWTWWKNTVSETHRKKQKN